MKFDELNQLKRFFAGMNISKAEQEKRVTFADLLYEAIYYVFTMIKIEQTIKEAFSQAEKVTADNALELLEPYRQTLENRIFDAFNAEDVPHEDDYIPKLVTEIIETTARHPDEDYYLSPDRALLIAQNECNTAYNYIQYVTAVSEGKLFKTWVAESDNRVRSAHAEIDGMTIPINEYFYVGGDTMRFPHDYINGTAGNLINCRCMCAYS